MFACVDVGYHDPHAIAACVVFDAWTTDTPLATHAVRIDAVEPYEPGAFFRRELPCLLRVLAAVTVPLDAILVDGFVWLDAARPGLGAHLHEALDPRTPIIGVAKTAYAGNTVAIEIVRGTSQNPLYITSIGIEPTVAAEHVRTMHGDHRIPTLLGLVDRLSRAT